MELSEWLPRGHLCSKTLFNPACLHQQCMMMMKTLFKHRVAHSAKAGIQRGPANALFIVQVLLPVATVLSKP